MPTSLLPARGMLIALAQSPCPLLVRSGVRPGATLMEYASLLAGEPRSERSGITHPVLASMARQVNNRLADKPRQRLLPLLGGLLGTGVPGGAPGVPGFPGAAGQDVLTVRLAAWVAWQGVRLAAEPVRGQCAAALAWSLPEVLPYPGESPVSGTRSGAARDRVSLSVSRAVDNVEQIAQCPDASVVGTWVSGVVAETLDALDAAADTAGGSTGDPVDLVGLLAALIGEYDRLTGRKAWTPVSADDLASLAVLAALTD